MFKEFIVGDILSVEQTKSVVAKSDLTEGNIPYVTRTVSGNGYSGTCGNLDKLNAGNCITIGAETGVAFYQPDDFVAGNKVYRLSRNGLGEKEYLYLAGALNKQTSNYSYSNARIPSKIKAETILLPVIEAPDPSHVYTADDIDWRYMHDAIRKIEKKHIANMEKRCASELDAYLRAAGLDSYELTNEDRQLISAHSAAGFRDESKCEGTTNSILLKPFEAFELFDIRKGKRLTKADMKAGDINFVGSSSANNGVTARIGNTEHLHPAHTITVSYNGSVGEVFLQDEPFWASDDVNVWYPKFSFDGEAIIYIMTVIRKLSIRYSYEKKWTIDRMRSERLYLPVIESSDPDHAYTIDDIDWQYMEEYIKAVEKQAIADVVRYRDAVIDATREVVSA